MPYVAREFDKLFADMGTKNDFCGFPQEGVFDRLGNHINEINAIHPFCEGNGRTMRHQRRRSRAMRVHPIRIAAIDKDWWLEASRHGFLTGDHRGMVAVHSAAAIKRDLAPSRPADRPGLRCFPSARHPKASATA